MPTAQKLHHVTLTVSDPERSAVFYRDLLGFETQTFATGVEAIPAGFYFTLDGVGYYFLKHAQSEPGDRFHETRIGLDHLSFSVESREELEVLSERLLAAGVDTKGLEQFPSGNWYIALRDPDNIQLEYWLPL